MSRALTNTLCSAFHRHEVICLSTNTVQLLWWATLLYRWRNWGLERAHNPLCPTVNSWENMSIKQCCSDSQSTMYLYALIHSSKSPFTTWLVSYQVILVCLNISGELVLPSVSPKVLGQVFTQHPGMNIKTFPPSPSIRCFEAFNVLMPE